MATSMNHLLSPIEDSFTRRVTRRKRPTVQTTIAFIGEHNYERPHTYDGILDIER